MESVETHSDEDIPNAEVFAKFICRGHQSFEEKLSNLDNIDETQIVIPRFKLAFNGIDDARSDLIQRLRREVRVETNRSTEVTDIQKIANHRSVINSNPVGYPETQEKKIGHVAISEDQKSYISDIRLDEIGKLLND